MGITIKEVAKTAKVSVGTVSRVINDHPNVDSRIQEQVKNVIRQLGYRPNARAQSLTRNSSPIISFILGNRGFLHPVHSLILHGVEEYCDQLGYMVLYTKFLYARDTPTSELQLPRVLQSHGIAECVILAGTNYDNFIDALERLRVPFVLLANNYVSQKTREPFDCVRFDDLPTAIEATEYLIRLGHQNIWFIGDVSLPWFGVMHQGYLAAMRHHGLEPLGQTVPLSDNPYTNGYMCAEMIVRQGRPVSALFSSDEVVLGAWDFLARAGLQVPRDVSLVGFDDIAAARARIPPLTTVRNDNAEIGRQLARMAIEKIKCLGKRLPEVVIPTKLIKRGTCQPPLENRQPRAGVVTEVSSTR